MKALGGVVLSVMLFSLAGCPARDSGPEGPSDLEVQNLRQSTKVDGNSLILGQVRNTSERPYSLVHIEFYCYDNNDKPLHNANAEESNLEAHGVWNFTAVMPQGATQFKLKQVNGVH
jgi:hypothetical protein